MSRSYSRYLITGSTGFIGKHVCDILKLNGENYHTIPHSRLFQPDKRDLRALEQCHSVIYLAGLAHRMDLQGSEHWSMYVRANAMAPGAVARLASAAGAKRFVYVSTIKVHGETTRTEPFRNTDGLNPSGVYAKSKVLGELHLAAVMRESLTRLIVVRPPLVYGASVRGNLLRMMQALKNGWPIPLGGASGIRSMISAGNLSEFLLHLCNCPVENLSSGSVRPYSGARPTDYYAFLPSDIDIGVSELLHQLKFLLGSRSKLFSLPEFLFRPTPLYSRLLSSLRVDVTPARATGWKNRVTSDQALKEMAQSFLGTHV